MTRLLAATAFRLLVGACGAVGTAALGAGLMLHADDARAQTPTTEGAGAWNSGRARRGGEIRSQDQPPSASATIGAAAGAHIVYNGWVCPVGSSSEANVIACYVSASRELKLYRGLVMYGDLPTDFYFQQAAQAECGSRSYRLPRVALPDSSKREVDKMFPLAVGKKASYRVDWSFGSGTLAVSLSDSVVRVESLTFGMPGAQKTADAHVIERSGTVSCAGLDSRADSFEFKQTIWFAADPGVIVKEQTVLGSGSLSGRKLSYDLVGFRGFDPAPAQSAAAAPPTPPPQPPAAAKPVPPTDTAVPGIEAAATVDVDTGIAELSGRVVDDSRIVELTLNGRPIAVEADGKFRVRRAVAVGTTTIKLAAVDEWGNRGEAAVAVTRAAPVAAAAPPPPAPKRVADGIHFGRYHALVIGNNAYKKLDRLKTAVGDAEAVSTRLTRDYGFNVTLLKDATRGDVFRQMAAYRRELGPDDNLLIYYAGHGVLDEVTERGYWLPVDAERDEQSNWISNADLTDALRALRAKHVMIVADSCYAGTLVRTAAARLDVAEERRVWIERVTKQRSRTALASGGLEPVVDSGGGQHSVFAKAFLQALDENTDVLEGQALFDKIKRPIALGADQTPRYADIRQAGHEGGDFLFVRR